MDMKSQSFGVEVEMKNIKRFTVARYIANYFNSDYDHVGQVNGLDTYEIEDTNGRVWKVVSDSSLHDGRKGCELVTPILYYNDLTDFGNIIDMVKESGKALIDEDCSIHIHIGRGDHTVKSLVNLVNVMYSYEDLIFESLKVIPQREEEYCKKVDERFLRRLNENKPQDMRDLEEIWYGSQFNERSRSSHYNETRYHNLNLHSLFNRHGTIEFRAFNGTIDRDVITSYIQFVLALSNYAKTIKTSRAKKVSLDNEKFSFRTFMIRIGLIGKEFTTCRKIFLKELTGNSAWR